MWIPLLLIGAFFAARAATKPRLALSAPMVSPLMLLDGFVRTNQQPPPQVLMSALAEAEQLQRDDIALAIVRKYIAPIVYRYELAHASDANAPGVPAQSQPLLMRPTSTTLSDEEIEAAMNADPSRFLATGQPPPSPAPPSPPINVPVASPPSAATRPPIEDVGELQWSAFCERLARETPLFVGKRHVGQYRASKQRLREIGVDPSVIAGSAERQRDALDREMADSWRHANAGGIVDEYGGRLIRLPGGGEATVSRSGILGIIQAAGLEGAVSWFEKPDDRQRYPNTTEVFMRTNGVF